MIEFQPKTFIFNRQAIEGYNFTPEHHQMLQNLPLRLLSTVSRLGLPESTEKETSKVGYPFFFLKEKKTYVQPKNVNTYLS